MLVQARFFPPQEAKVGADASVRCDIIEPQIRRVDARGVRGIRGGTMSDPRASLQAKFQPEHRYNNFGDVLVQMHVKGFRCHSNTLIEIQSPISAFCGLNGTGKSTLLQLAAAAYDRPDRNSPRYYIKYFLVVGTLDPNPFTDDARVEFKFWQEDRSVKILTISRRAQTKRWSGYTRRLPRSVLFAGIGLYLPKVERHDFFIRYASKLAVENTEEVADNIKRWTCKVLGHTYENMQRSTVSYSNRRESVVSVERNNCRYSEAHMGYGEGRSQYLINALEGLPPKSLVLIEEPETSLHDHAQHEFGKYLVDVAGRKGHQILLTTHSEALLQALPSASRIYLHSTPAGIEPINGLTALQAKSLMAQGREKALHVLVEDSAGKAILTEMLRKADPTFLATAAVNIGGSCSTIKTTIKTLQSSGLPVAAVLDGDQAATPNENIFKLPGTEAPEKELFACAAAQKLIATTYGMNLVDFQTGLVDVDHHEWCARLAGRLNHEESALLCEMARAYAEQIPESERTSLVDQLKEASRK